jgi:hypothetical protein
MPLGYSLKGLAAVAHPGRESIALGRSQEQTARRRQLAAAPE